MELLQQISIITGLLAATGFILVVARCIYLEGKAR